MQMRTAFLKRAACMGLTLLLAGMLPVSALAEGSAEGLERSETVYVTASATGGTKSILSSVYIVNADGREFVEDVSRLTNVKNILSNEAPNRQGDTLRFHANAEDVCFQGEASDELPFTMEVTYELDGKRIEPDQLAGRSGHVRVTVTYKNLLFNEIESESGTLSLYTPLNIVTFISLTDDFSAVQCTNAHVMSETGSRSVIGLNFPGLAYNLQQEAVDELSESMSFEADVTSFSLDSIMTVVMPDIFDGNELERIDELKDIVDGFATLSEAGEQLAFGGSSLSKGIKEIAAGMGELSNALSKMADQVGRLSDSVLQAQEKINEGIASAGSAIDDAISKIDGVLIGGADAAADRVIASISGELTEEQKAEIRAAVKAAWNDEFGSLASALESTKKQLQAIKALLPKVQQAADQLFGLANQFNDGVQALSSAGQQLADGLDKLDEGASGLRGGLWKFYNEGLMPLEESMSGLQLALDRKDAMLTLAREYTSFSGDPGTTNGNVRFIVTTDSIYVPSATPEPVLPAEEEPEPGFFERAWEWIKNLFGG